MKLKVMRSLYIVGTIIALVGIISLIYLKIISPYLDDRTVSTTFPVTIHDDFGDFTFSYPAGEKAYTLVEPPVPTTTSTGLQKVYIILNTQDYIALEDSDIDTPPTVSVFVFQRIESDEEGTRLEKLQFWIEQFSQFSSYSSRVDEPEVIDIDGIPTMRYHTEGTYKQEVYVSTYRGIIYVFTGQYENESDEIFNMFTKLISSVVYE